MANFIRELEEWTARAIATSSLTNALIHVLSRGLANKSADSIEAYLLEAALPEPERAGIMLPWLTAGRMADYQLNLRGPVALTLAAFCAGGQAGKNVVQLFASIPEIVMTNQARVSVGSAAFYRDTSSIAAAPSTWQSPQGLLHATSRLSVPAMFASQGLTPEKLGTGYAGAIELKGNLSESAPAAIGGGGAATAADGALAAAAGAAAQLEKVGK